MTNGPRRLAWAIPLTLALWAAPATARDEAIVMANAVRTLEMMASNPNDGVPVGLLRRSEGVVVVPHMLNAGFVVGAKLGRGVFIVRDSKGRWGNPIFVHVSGGSFGLQAGAQDTEILMVFRSKETVTRLLAGKGKITLGVDAGVAAGPVGKNVGADTDLGMKAEILTYAAKSRGLFAGASLGGSGISVDRRNDAAYYNAFGVTTFQIIEGDGVGAPLEAAKFKAILSTLTDPPGPGDPVVIDGVVVEPKPDRRARPLPAADLDVEAVRPVPRRRSTLEADEPAPPRGASVPARRPPSGPDEPEAEADRFRPASRPRPVRPATPPVVESEPIELEPLPAPVTRPRPGPAPEATKPRL